MSTVKCWVRDEARRICKDEKVLEFLASVVKGKKERTIDRIRASEILLDRGFGKSPQGIEVSGIEGNEFSGLSTAQLDALINALAGKSNGKAQSGAGKKEGS